LLNKNAALYIVCILCQLIVALTLTFHSYKCCLNYYMAKMDWHLASSILATKDAFKEVGKADMELQNNSWSLSCNILWQMAHSFDIVLWMGIRMCWHLSTYSDQHIADSTLNAGMCSDWHWNADANRHRRYVGKDVLKLMKIECHCSRLHIYGNTNVTNVLTRSQTTVFIPSNCKI
jgi:hypothetical protein